MHRKPAHLDPWAHRRGEPRLFAVLWMIYVIVAVLGSVQWVLQTTDLSPGAYAPAARIMLAVIAAGATILWPMTRLSQAAPSPARAIPAAILADVLVVLLPAWMVVVPLVGMAGWPIDIVAALAIMLGGWVYLVGGLLTLALINAEAHQASPPHASPTHVSRSHNTQPAWFGRRGAWMALLLIIVAGGLLVYALYVSRSMRSGGVAPIPAWAPMLSIFSAIPALTGHGMSGPQGAVSPTQWVAILSTCGLGVLVWSAAGLYSTLLSRRAPSTPANTEYDACPPDLGPEEPDSAAFFDHDRLSSLSSPVEPDAGDEPAPQTDRNQ